MREKSNGIVLSGDRPTGKLHLGHLLGSIKNRVALQEKHESFYMIADLQALTDNADNPSKIHEAVREVALDNLSCGVDPEKTTFFIQSEVRELSELTIYFLNLVTLACAKRNPTVKDEMKQKGYGENVPMGFLSYPISQAADILFCKARYVPVGEDQLPMIEQTNEIVEKFNTLYGETFKRVEPVLSKEARLVGIDGKGKMSKSLGNAIFLADSAEVVAEKVMKMYTDPRHIRAEDPGHLEGNAVFQFLDIFDEHQENLKELKHQYIKGGLGDTQVKERLVDVLERILKPIREKREKLAQKPDDVTALLKAGTEKAREIARETLGEVRKKMRLDYF